MINTTDPTTPSQGNEWLKPYYFSRAAFSIIWVALAFTVGKSSPVIAALLLLVYPAWDAVANYVDARQAGGLKGNRTQAFNMIVSAATAAAVAIALGMDLNAVLGVFGAWAILSGSLQLATAVRRWNSHGAQWPMILSGGQSVLAGFVFIHQARGATTPGIFDIAAYAAVGAFYFLVSAIWLTVTDMRLRRTLR